MNRISRLIGATALVLLPFACSSSQPSGPPAGADAGGGYDAGQSTGVTCGGTACTVPLTGRIELLKACCTDAGGCGLQLSGVDKCLPKDMPGSANAPECPTPKFTTPGGNALAPCCGPSGCGALDPFLGCIAGPHIGAPATSCAYDPTNDCTLLTSVTCDGAEDCPSGQRCCGKLVGFTYTQFGCFDSCSAMADGGNQFRWLELCHAGDKCENASFSCLASTVLPAPLARCDGATAGGGDPLATADKSAHHVDCGGSVCGADEKCCVRTPHAPYCSKANEPCQCHPADGGGASPGGADASSLRDATPD